MLFEFDGKTVLCTTNEARAEMNKKILERWNRKLSEEYEKKKPKGKKRRPGRRF